MDPELTEFDPAEKIEDAAAGRVWLETFLDDGTPEEFASAIGDIARAYGVAQISRETGIPVEKLFKALNGFPSRMDDIVPILTALGVTPAQRTDAAE